MLAAITAVSLVNLVHRATSEPSEALGAAAEPIGYDNALGLLAALGLLLALDGALRSGPWLVALAAFGRSGNVESKPAKFLLRTPDALERLAPWLEHLDPADRPVRGVPSAG